MVRTNQRGPVPRNMLLAFGALSFRDLAVREYPNIIPPIVSVQTSYPGASADVVETRISQVLEGELSGIEGIKTIRSTSRDQSSSISIEFTLDRGAVLRGRRVHAASAGTIDTGRGPGDTERRNRLRSASLADKA